jgi:hypothetical protein
VVALMKPIRKRDKSVAVGGRPPRLTMPQASLAISSRCKSSDEPGPPREGVCVSRSGLRGIVANHKASRSRSWRVGCTQFDRYCAQTCFRVRPDRIHERQRTWRNEAAGAAVEGRSQYRLLSERIVGFSQPNPSGRRFFRWLRSALFAAV